MSETNPTNTASANENGMTRREALAVGTAAALGAAAGARPGAAQNQRMRPVAVASKNGLEAVRIAVDAMEAGASPVEAAVEGVAVVESDPDDVTVGYGGLPNSEGVVQLDACCMDGSTMRAGAVAALEGIMHPAQVALDVMRRTTRVLLVGDGAARFARTLGYETENLLTERSRKIWVYWKSKMSDIDDWMVPADDVEDPDIKWFIEKYGDIRPTGTINLCAVDGDGVVGGTTTTSGLFFKLPGRVGDSPLIGAGLFVDGEVGAAGSTGRGESVIQIAGAHTIIEFMRAGQSPTDACLGALDRMVSATRVPYLLDDQGRPNFGVNFYAVNTKGESGGANFWEGSEHSWCQAGSKPELRPSASLFKTPPPWKKS